METAINVQVMKSQLEQFQKKLNEEPPQSDIVFDDRYKLKRKDKTTGQETAVAPRYLPISFVQMKLDELFFGLWETKIDHVQVIANEIIGHGRLIVTHPVTGQKIERTGSAAVMVLQRKDADITDVSAKIKNTLVKDYPHLLAEITKSAAKTLGKIFGRDLNREHTDNYSPYTVEVEAADEVRAYLKAQLEANALPAATHSFVEATVDVATFKQLCQMKAQVETILSKQLAPHE